LPPGYYSSMRQIIGNRTVDLSAADFAALRAGHRGVLLDAGTGDGKHALHTARC
jgi:16S rRNA (adenine(1408)-N(1))-methyltransferase